MILTEPNDGKHIDRIIMSHECSRHKALLSEPCWSIDSVHGLLRAICNSRALAAGAQGKITPYERTTSHFKKERI